MESLSFPSLLAPHQSKSQQPHNNVQSIPDTIPSTPKVDQKSSSVIHKVEPREKPKRPLSAYNIFFRNERQNIRQQTPTRVEGKPRRSHGKIGFADLARSIAAKWKDTDPVARCLFIDLAARDKKRYIEEMQVWKRKQISRMKLGSCTSKGSTDYIRPASLDMSTHSLTNNFPGEYGKITATLPMQNQQPHLVPDGGWSPFLSQALECHSNSMLAATGQRFDVHIDPVNDATTSYNIDPFSHAHGISELAQKLDPDSMDLLFDIFRCT
jgi:hypothetical protein